MMQQPAQQDGNIAYLPSRRAMEAYQGAGESEDEAYEPPYKLAELVAMFEEAEEASRKARALSERCRDYYDNKQLTSEEIADLLSRGQPEIIRNQIKAKVNFYLGFEAKNRSDPKAQSEHGTTEEEADAATDMLRFQERRADLDQKFSDCWEHMLIEGWAAVEVLGPSKKDPRVIEVKRWKWDRLFHDPHSQEHDFSDATYIGGVIWMDDKEAKKKWPKPQDANAITGAQNTASRTNAYDDKPKWTVLNGNRVRLRVVQMYYQCDDEWHWALFTVAGIIEAGRVELKDEQGHSVCPMIAQALYVDRENNRYGEVAEFLWTQDEINKRASKALHLANSSQTMGEQGSVLDVDEMKAQKANPDGHINLAPGMGDKFKFVDHDNAIKHQRDFMMDAQMAIEKRGPNASLMGTQTNAPSGRAIRANQEGGMVEGARPRDRYTNLKTRVYRAQWQRVRQFCDAPTWISITEDDGATRYVGFNQPTTMAQKLVDEARKKGMQEDEIQQRIGALAQDPSKQQQLQQQIMTNVPMEMDVNFIIEPVNEGLPAEQTFELLSQRKDVPLEMLVEFWPGSAREKKRMRDWIEKQQAKQAQANQVAAKLKADNLMADTEGKRAKAMKDLADADMAGMADAGATAQPAAASPEQASPYGAAGLA